MEFLAKNTQEDLITATGVLESEMQRIRGLLTPKLKRDTVSLPRGLSHFRSDWHQSTASPDTLTTRAGLDEKKGKSLPHVMPLMLRGVSVSFDHTASLNRKFYGKSHFCDNFADGKEGLWMKNSNLDF